MFRAGTLSLRDGSFNVVRKKLPLRRSPIRISNCQPRPRSTSPLFGMNGTTNPQAGMSLRFNLQNMCVSFSKLTQSRYMRFGAARGALIHGQQNQNEQTVFAFGSRQMRTSPSSFFGRAAPRSHLFMSMAVSTELPQYPEGPQGALDFLGRQRHQTCHSRCCTSWTLWPCQRKIWSRHSPAGSDFSRGVEEGMP